MSQHFTLFNADVSCQVDGKANHLIRDGEHIAMQAKTMELLVYLARHQGDVISREQIIEVVWQGTPVVDNALTNAIAKIRKALGESKTRQPLLETVPKVGYRLVAQVTWHEQANLKPVINDTFIGSPKRVTLLLKVASIIVLVLFGFALGFWLQPATVKGSNAKPNLHESKTIKLDLRSIAILPFKESGLEPVPLHIREGMALGIRNQLAQQSDLKVVTQSSSSANYLQALPSKEIAAELGVDALIRGSIEQQGKIITIKLLLNRGSLSGAHSNQTVFETSKSASLDKLVALQMDLANEVMNFIKPGTPEIAAQSKPAFAAYDLYLLGRFHLKKRDKPSLQKAIDFLSQATKLDDSLAEAYSALASAYILSNQYANLSLAQAESLAEPALYKALSLNSRLAEAHASHGLLRAQFGELDSAIQSYQRAIDLAPNYAMAKLWLGSVYRDQFEYALAQSYFEQALAIDPLNLVILSHLASLKLDLGLHTQGIGYYQKIFTIDANATVFYRSAARRATFEGLYDYALTWATKALELAPDDPLNQNILAMVYIDLGQFERAEALLQQSKGESQNNLLSRATWYRYYWFSGQWDKLKDYGDNIIAQVAASASYSEKQYVLNVYKTKGAVVHILRGDYQQAIDLMAPAMSQIDSQQVNFHLFYLPYLAYAYQQNGQQLQFEATQKQSWALVERLLGSGSQQRLKMAKAILLAIQNRDEEAIALLVEIADNGWQGYIILKNTPQFKRLERYKAYQVLLMNLKASLK